MIAQVPRYNRGMKFSSLVFAAAAVSCCAFVHPQESADKKAFDKFKTLVGTWKGKAGFGEDMSDTTVTYKLVGGGTTLVETLFEGTPHEMVSMYHMDGDSFVMTHYCAAGNQPTFKYKSTQTERAYTLDFWKGSNMKESDMHMHTVRFFFAEADHVVSEWTSWQNGKDAGTVKFDLKRQK